MFMSGCDRRDESQSRVENWYGHSRLQVYQRHVTNTKASQPEEDSRYPADYTTTAYCILQKRLVDNIDIATFVKAAKPYLVDHQISSLVTMLPKHAPAQI